MIPVLRDNMNLLNNLKSRYEVAKNFTKDYQEQVKTAVKDYKAENPEIALDKVDVIEVSQNKYKLIYPLIFVNHEAMMASMFDRVPDLIFNGKGKDDEEKKNKVVGAYNYLRDKLSLEWFLNDSAWWFILAGMATAQAGYKQVTKDVPLLDEMGQPVIDQMTGKPQMRTVLEYDDPTIETSDPLKIFFSPESQYTVDFSKVPYYFIEDLMDPNEVKRIYKTKVEPDATIDIKTDKKSESADLQRVKVKMYYGTIPEENKGEVEGWDFDKKYLVVMTENKILHKEATQNLCRGLRLHGVPNEFFGFGIAKLLRASQNEKSTRRSQQIRYADVMSMPKIAQDETTKVDENALVDPRVGIVVTYSDKKPEYMSPPTMPETLILAEQHVDSDAQQISGLLDLSTGAQQTMTDKATGQQIFADAAEKRVRAARRKLIEYYKQCVIMLLKLAQENWSGEKVVSITDDNGQNVDITISAEDLKDIDFDKDIQIDGESMVVNKDVLRQQAIEFYNSTKDDPIIERSEVVKDVLSDGFGKRNPEKYIAQSGLTPGMTLTAQTGETYTVDESGKVVPAQDMQSLGQPADIGQATTPGGLQGGVNNMGGL